MNKSVKLTPKGTGSAGVELKRDMNCFISSQRNWRSDVAKRPRSQKDPGSSIGDNPSSAPRRTQCAGILAQSPIFVKHHLRPDHSLGQNFLIDERVLQKIIEAAELHSDDTVIEIGTGLGTLTVELAKRAGRVITFEIDKKLLPILRENLVEFTNVEIKEEDFLGTVLPNGAYKIVANLPYQITSAAIEKILESEPRPELMVLLVQREVAERICACPGEMSLLSVAVQYYGEPEIVARVPAGAFWPAPKVESAILKITLHSSSQPPHQSPRHGTGQASPPRGEGGDRAPSPLRGRRSRAELAQALGKGEGDKAFFKLVKAGFSRRRAMLKNNLRTIMSVERLLKIFRELDLNQKIRAQDLSVEQWQGIAQLWYN